MYVDSICSNKKWQCSGWRTSFHKINNYSLCTELLRKEKQSYRFQINYSHAKQSMNNTQLKTQTTCTYPFYTHTCHTPLLSPKEFLWINKVNISSRYTCRSSLSTKLERFCLWYFNSTNPMVYLSGNAECSFCHCMNISFWKNWP